jgi:hypothetical protein
LYERTALAMRNIILSGVGLVVAYWVDHYYYNGIYSAALADELNHIATAFK